MKSDEKGVVMESFLDNDEPELPPLILSYDTPEEIDRTEIFKAARGVAFDFCERCALLIIALFFVGVLALPLLNFEPGVEPSILLSLLFLYVAGLVYWFIAVTASCWIRLRLTKYELKHRPGAWWMAIVLVGLPWLLAWLFSSVDPHKLAAMLAPLYLGLPWAAGLLLFRQRRMMNE
jgi:hypothetical protein